LGGLPIDWRAEIHSEHSDLDTVREGASRLGNSEEQVPAHPS